MTVLISILLALFISSSGSEFTQIATQGNITYCDEMTGACLFEYIDMRIENHNSMYETLINDKPVAENLTKLPEYVIKGVDLIERDYSDTVAVWGDDSIFIEAGNLTSIVFFHNDNHYEFIVDSLSF